MLFEKVIASRWSGANQLRRIKTGPNFPGQTLLATDTPKHCLLTVIVFNKLYKLLQAFLFQLEDRNGTYMVLCRNVPHNLRASGDRTRSVSSVSHTRSCYNLASVTTFSTKPESPRDSAKAPPAGASQPGSVPILDLQRQYEQVRAEVLAAVGRVCASQQYILGPEVEALERELAEFCGAQDAVGCASGTDALWLALVAAGVRAGDQVLTTPFSFFASAGAIVRAGARPVFADIEPDSFNLDPAKVLTFLRGGQRDNIRALLAVHLYGQCADMNSLPKVADEFHLALIEDAAQAIGARRGERKAGSMGVSAAFSFYPTKNLSAYGDAGLVTTNDTDSAAQMRRLRNHGSPRRYVHEEFGWNSRLDAIQAAILRVKLKYVAGWNEGRRERAARYDQLFTEAGLNSTGDQAENSAPISLPQTSADTYHVFHQYVVRAFRRDELREFLSARKIGTEIYYPIPLHLQPCFIYLGYQEGDFPEAERAAKEVLALPMFPELTDEEQQWVVKSIADFYC
jgi:dTDP-4-amino-4,6-dideoxygalactose transaminase